MYKLVFFCPVDDAEKLKSAVFAAGAGAQGEYAEVAFESRGTTQFRPLPDADPHIGTPGELTRVDEMRIEILCTPAQIRPARDALIKAHPYESPVYDIYRVETMLD